MNPEVVNANASSVDYQELELQSLGLLLVGFVAVGRELGKGVSIDKTIPSKPLVPAENDLFRC